MEGGTGLREVVVVGRVATKVKGVCYYVGKGLLPPLSRAGTHTFCNFFSPQKNACTTLSLQVNIPENVSALKEELCLFTFFKPQHWLA